MDSSDFRFYQDNYSLIFLNHSKMCVNIFQVCRNEEQIIAKLQELELDEPLVQTLQKQTLQLLDGIMMTSLTTIVSPDVFCLCWNDCDGQTDVSFFALLQLVRSAALGRSYTERVFPCTHLPSTSSLPSCHMTQIWHIRWLSVLWGRFPNLLRLSF